MTCSPEKLASNRRNAQNSTGPKTAEGKAISRANALKHGLTGEGVVFSSDQTEAINIRVARLQAELQPATVMGEVLVQRIGVLSVRLECCQERETEVVHTRIAQALRDFDDTRLEAADALFDQLGDNPAGCLRMLERTEQGLRKLLQCWTNLKSDLIAGCWKPAHGLRLAHLQGLKPDDCFALRLIAMSEAVQGRFEVRQSAQMNNTTRTANAKTELTALIDTEIAGLNHRMATLDPTELAEAKALVIAQAKLDAAPAVHQIQKYEASTERSMFRMMKEARLVESAATLVDQAKPSHTRSQSANAAARTTSAPLASFSQITVPAAEPVSKPEKIDESPLTEEERLEVEAYFGRSNVSIEEILEETQKIQARMAALNATTG